jgi:phosphoribosylaminoimidazole-succinocarboxamide synthase
VREIFDLGDALLISATDRLSAFDVILPDGIPGKGIVLTQISLWWFAQVRISSPTTSCPTRPACWRANTGSPATSSFAAWR